MHIYTLERWRHNHRFHRPDDGNERSTRRVMLLTIAMMIVEIAGGMIYGSMALLADGWHMGTHAVALGISAAAYRFARRHADSPHFSFGTGKVGDLGGFASAVVLAVVALLMAVESVERLLSPRPIQFNEAIAVAVAGLAVNVVSALLLRDHEADDHDRGHHHHDHNLKAAYLHVLADALTSLLAIVALLAGKGFGWVWMDPLMGVVGAAIITRWSWGLLRDTGRVLLDRDVDPGPGRRDGRAHRSGLRQPRRRHPRLASRGPQPRGHPVGRHPRPPAARTLPRPARRLPGGRARDRRGQSVRRRILSDRKARRLLNGAGGLSAYRRD